MIRNRILGIVFFLLVAIQIQAQNTVGLIRHDTGSLDDGYVFFAPFNSKKTYLIDKCGRQINSWTSGYTPGASAYFLPNGKMLRTGNVGNTTFTAGGQGGLIEIKDWNGSVVWSYTLSDTGKCQHHDVAALPNGNVLVIAWEKKTNAEAVAAGRNPSLVSSEIWSEQILEIRPSGTNGGSVVWEWHLWDHLVQGFDAAKANYNTIDQNPQLLDINYGGIASIQDWVHLNSIDYNPTLDQIMVSSHNHSEIWIIDHSTTTAQAAGHSGGNAGKGGDFLYRWGNPQVYGKGTQGTRKLYGQHNAHWIPSGLPNAGQIMIFNNGLGRQGVNYSTVEIINPPLNGFTYNATLPYLPTASSWTYNATNQHNFFAVNISGAQQLSNGNVLICDGPSGAFTEVNSAEDSVWEYVNPVKNGGVIAQGNAASQNLAFRCSFYPSSYSGFTGVMLAPGNIIEDVNTVSANCQVTLGIADNSLSDGVSIYPNPAQDYITVSNTNHSIQQVAIFNTLGQSVYRAAHIANKDRLTIQTSGLASGLYFVEVSDGTSSVRQKLFIER